MTTALTIILKNKGLSILPDNAQWQNRFEIESQTSDKLYTIAQRKSSGEWACSCFGWIRFRKCKHLTAIMPLIEQAQKTEQKQLK
jgi:hypothetical protein